MYHNLCSNPTDSIGLTLFCDKFEQQMKYLVQQQYTFFFASEILAVEYLPKKSMVITFDDVTQNQLDLALPILEKYKIKATFFIPFGYIGKTDLWNQSKTYIPQKIMTIEQLKSINSAIIEFGHHTFYHKRFSNLSTIQIQEEFDASYQFISDHGLKVFQSIAYPYGDYPKKTQAKNDFFETLKLNSMQMGFRIGNRINSFPITNPFEIQRIDIRGNCTQMSFWWKIRFGKTLLF